ncbi:MAG: helix-turn-helix domain-containing protein [Bdellovibrionales bacterium]|nr:helix-turn-helix domain-containing protein [Bdellovibrionales bacterium]
MVNLTVAQRIMTKENKVNELGEFLRERRKAVGLSQGEVGKKLGYSSAQFVSNFERGNCTPPLKALKTLVRIYNIEPEELIELVMKDKKEKIEREFYS